MSALSMPAHAHRARDRDLGGSVCGRRRHGYRRTSDWRANVAYLGQTVIIENVVGGGSTLANDRVARSAPDGSTVLINHVALLAAPSLFTNLRYDTKTAFEAVGLVNSAPMVLIGRKSIPGAGPKDFVAGSRRKATRRILRTVVSGQTVTCAPS